jgi:F0F1-type ATP synthase membrane subunit b/b'
MPQLKPTLSSLVLMMGFLLLTVVPVMAQVSTPTPAAVNNATLDALARAVDALERLSASTDTTLNAAVLLQIIVNLVIFGGGLAFVWRGGLKPLHDTMTSDRQRAAKAEEDEKRVRDEAAEDKRLANEHRSRQATALEAVASHQERTAKILSETEDKAQSRTDNAVQAINDHTDEALKPVGETLDGVVKSLKELRENVVTQSKFDDAMTPLKEAIDAIIQKVGALQPLTPVPAPPPDAPSDPAAPERTA